MLLIEMSVSYSGNRQSSNRLTRDELVREYNSKNAERARNARTYSNDTMRTQRESRERARLRNQNRSRLDQVRKEEEERAARRRARERDLQASEARQDANLHMNEAKIRQRNAISKPLSSQEFKENTRRSYEHYEKERAARDPFLRTNSLSKERTVIDGRGTIDSRTFNERHEISNKTSDERDKHDPEATSSAGKTRWKTHSSRADGPAHASTNTLKTLDFSRSGIGNSYSELPQFVKYAIPVIIILLLIVIFLLFR